MGFNEKVHAYIAAKYYVYLKESFKSRGIEAFKFATRYYAEQRGRRMALRAIADGEPLTYETYRKYGEWVNTEEIKDLGQSNQSESISISPDYEIHVTRCPWAAQFKEMNLQEAGVAYCSNLDPSIARGFSPEIKYSTTQTLHDNDYCIQRVENSGLTEGGRPLKKEDGLKSFTYHCAHSYWSYREIAIGIFGEEGKTVAEKVLDDLAKDYGKDAKEKLLRYEKVNFNINSPEL